jgi:hypothetical protein
MPTVDTLMPPLDLADIETLLLESQPSPSAGRRRSR